jgi:cystathionine beta-synthase
MNHTIIDTIGNTPLVKLNKLPHKYGIDCEILAKCEYLNAGGSIKDRIAKRMIEDAEKSGKIKPGDTLIEPTSGNTGIGIALVGVVKGYKVIITMPDKMSQEKSNVLKLLDVDIIRTPTSVSSDSPDSHINIAKQIRDKINRSNPNTAHILDQYSNPSNPMVHYDTTALELLEQTNHKIDMIVIGAGTGGTISGIGKRFKEILGNKVQVIGVDPHGSLLAKEKEPVHNYDVEGIGYDFIPDVLNRNVVDDWVKTNDKDSFTMARELIRYEGLLVGGSSGSIMSAAIQAIQGNTLFNKTKPLQKGETCVIILPDSIRNYMTKFVCDDWMTEHGYS